MSSNLTIIHTFNDEAILKAGTAEYIVDLSRYNTEGFFSLQAQVESAGAGAVDFTFAVSNDGVTYLESATKIFTAMTKTDGPGSDGHDIASFEPVLSKYLKIIATETNVAAVTVNGILGLQ